MTRFAVRSLALLVLAPLAASCGSGGVDPTGGAYKALSAGNYEQARDLFWAMHTKSPDDPFVTLDLAEAYQGLDRMDLAEPYYRQLIDNGGDIVPTTTPVSEKGKTVAQIACEHLRRGLKDPSAC